MQQESIKLLKELTDIYGVSGQEGDVSKYIASQLAPYTSDIVYDALGSIIVRGKGNHPLKVAIATHIDEVGFVVKHISPDGKLLVFNLGNISIIPDTPVMVKTKDGAIQGVIKTESNTYDDLYIDIECSSKEDVYAKGVVEGAWVCFINDFHIDGDTIKAKALDNRISCAVAIELFKELSDSLSYQFYLIGTAQEEVGTRGAKTSTQVVKPDICIVLDVASPKQYKYTKTRILGEGAVICLADKTALSDIHLVEKFSDIAKKHNIPIQYDSIGGGTDAGGIQQNNIKTVTIVIPVDKCHTPECIASTKDYKNTFLLLKEYLLSIN